VIIERIFVQRLPSEKSFPENLYIETNRTEAQ